MRRLRTSDEATTADIGSLANELYAGSEKVWCTVKCGFAPMLYNIYPDDGRITVIKHPLCENNANRDDVSKIHHNERGYKKKANLCHLDFSDFWRKGTRRTA